MTGAGDEDELLADVCRTLQRAGFDLVSDKDADGLRVRREADAVVVTWEPSPVPGPAPHATEHEGMRVALRHALTVILTQTGHAVQVDAASGEAGIARGRETGFVPRPALAGIFSLATGAARSARRCPGRVGRRA